MNEKRKYVIAQFLQHQYLCGAFLLTAWFSINVLLLATNRWFEFSREGKTIPLWEPFSWEISSQVMILILIPIALYIHDRWIDRLKFKFKLLIHLLMTLPFSAVHILGMVGIRKLWYQLMDNQYSFGNLPMEILYEYRKDAQTYLTLAIIILGYRFIIRRLQGEASYLTKDEESDSVENESPPERLLIKKLGREFLIQIVDIEWIEASGNYANLHIKGSLYPMRITMDKLEKYLPSQFIRIHRSTIVNLAQIKDVQPLDTGDHQVTLRNQTTLTLSRRYREAFKSQLSISS